jgi:hypothetical protein
MADETPSFSVSKPTETAPVKRMGRCSPQRVVSEKSINHSRGVPVEIIEHSAETFAALDPTMRSVDFVSWLDSFAFESLVIPFAMVVGEVLVSHASQMCFTEANYSIDGLSFERTVEPLVTDGRVGSSALLGRATTVLRILEGPI